MLSALSKGHLERSPWPCLKSPLDGAKISKWIILGRDGKYPRGHLQALLVSVYIMHADWTPLSVPHFTFCQCFL